MIFEYEQLDEITQRRIKYQISELQTVNSEWLSIK